MSTYQERHDAIDHVQNSPLVWSKPGNPCKVCGTPDSEKPMTFRGEDYCCENHRKMLAKEVPLTWPKGEP